MYLGITLPASPIQANTRDIIGALARVLPAATKQAEALKLAKTGDPVKDARRVAAWVQKNITYQRDGLQNQNIKLPSALLHTRSGDCKSFALFISAVLSSWGYKNGYRFAAYKNETPTHVYNFVLDNSGGLHTFDACISNLRESPKATYTEDMRVQYLAGVPVMFEDNATGINGKRAKARREKRRAEGRGFGQRAKKIALAPGRGAFLALLLENMRGLATKMAKVNPEKLSGFWGKLGGDKKKLAAAIEKGKGKKPLLGMNGHGAYPEGEYIGSAIAAAAAAAAPIVIGAVKMLKDAGIDAQDVGDFIKKVAPDAEPLGDFEATDPETKEAAAVTKQTPGAGAQAPTGGDVNTTGFKVSPLMIGGAALAIYFLTKKKGRK